jgi:hypothetical protein
MSPLPESSWPEPGEDAPAPRVVRHFTLTNGRAHTDVEIPLEATIRKLSLVDDTPPPGGVHGRILEMCDTKSLAEVSANLSMPIGVARVLVGDLVEQGHLRIQATITDESSYDERRDLIERTLRGLRSL